MLGLSILVVPDGQAGVRISQLSGVRPGTLFAGTHLIVPLVDRVQFFDVRDRVFSTTALAVRNEKLEVLEVQAREGLSVGLEVTVRYRIDPSRLAFIQANVPQPVDSEIVEPTVVSRVPRDRAELRRARSLFDQARGVPLARQRN